MKKLIEVLALCLVFQMAAAALDITPVSTATVKGAVLADFDFSGMTVKGVAWQKGAVIMPLTENRGKTFADIKLLSKKAYARLETCFKGGCAPEKAAAAPKIKVSAFKPLKSPSRVANAEVSFDGELLVVAGVMASSKEAGTFWVAFPPELEFSDPAFKSAVESAVIAAWTKKNK
jgi:predicted lipoprotein